jgi:hypothetical protein
MFKDTVPFKDPAAIEKQTKANVEAIWANSPRLIGTSS